MSVLNAWCDGVGEFTMIEVQNKGKSSTIGGDDTATLAVEAWVGGDRMGDVGVGVDDDGKDNSGHLSPATLAVEVWVDGDGMGNVGLKVVL